MKSRITVLFVFMMGAVAMAQLPTATILGVVKDATGAVVPNASLTARNVETGQSRTAVSGGDGSYRFAALPVGAYEVRAEHAGFQAELRRSLTLTVGQEAVVHFSLQIGAIEQAVSVTAEAPLVNTTSGSLGGLVNAEKVADLPLNGRNFMDLTLLQPGIARSSSVSSTSANTPGVFFSSNGAPVTSNTYLLDGALMQSVIGGNTGSASGSTLGIEGIREWRVITNSFSAEYGMTMGSQTTIVTKGGTNSFHGSAFEFLRNSALDARNFFDRKTATTPRRIPNFVRNDYGGSLGGPIRKDRMFFFGTYEGLRDRLGRTIVSDDLPLAARVAQIDPRIRPLVALFPEPNLSNNQFTFPAGQVINESFGQGRWDWTISQNDTFFGRFTQDNTDKQSPQSFPQFPFKVESKNEYTTASEGHVFSPALLNTFRFSYSRTELNFDSASGLRGPQFSFVPGQDVGSIRIGGVSNFGPLDGAPAIEKQNIFTWSDDLFYTRGDHSLKFGTLINRYQQFLMNGIFSRGSLTFPNVQSFLLGQPSSFTAVTPGSIIDRTFHYTTLGFYLQDDWRMKPNFTLNAGLRYEFYTTPEEVKGHGVFVRDLRSDSSTTLGDPIRNPSKPNLSPRLGFAWDVKGEGKTAVRGGFGLLFDIATLGANFLTIAPATPPFSSRSTLTGAQAPALFNIPLFFPPEAVGKSLRIIDHNIEQPYMMQYNLAVERQLPFQMALTVAYAGSRGVHIADTTEGNPVVSQILPDGRKFFPANSPRRNPNFSNIDLKTAQVSSRYNSLQVGLIKQLSKGLQLQSSFTWSKAIDLGPQATLSNETVGTSDFPTDPENFRLDKGNASFDITRVWRLNGIYRLPDFYQRGGAPGKLLNGWWLGSILSVQDGLPFTAVLNTNRSRSGVSGGSGGIDRPDLLPGRNGDNIILGGPTRYFDPSAFTVPEAGFLGTAGRNILRGPGLANLDLSISKDTPVKYLGENGKLEFRAEFFNVANRANFQIPGIGGTSAGTNTGGIVFAGSRVGEAPLPTAGRINETSTTSRQIQFALKLIF